MLGAENTGSRHTGADMLMADTLMTDTLMTDTLGAENAGVWLLAMPCGKSLFFTPNVHLYLAFFL